MTRQACLESLGWTVIRFTSDDVEQDAETVGRAIVKATNLSYQFTRREATGSGMQHTNALKNSESK